MAQGDDEARRLRARLEAAQTELKQAKDELIAAKAELLARTEEAQFLKWSLEGGESKGLILALAESRAEVARLQRQLAALRGGGAALAPPAKSRVCLISVADRDADALPITWYVGFVIQENGNTADLVRSLSPDVARAAVEREAHRLGLPIEDLT